MPRDGGIYVAFNPPLPSNGAPARYPRPIFLELGSDGAATDTLYAGTRFTRQCPTLSSNAWRAGYYEDLREPYFPKVKWALSPSGVLALGCPAEFEVDLVQLDGSILRITRDAEPIMVSEEERQSFVDAHTFRRNRSGQFDSWSWEGPQPPDRRPAYDRMVFGMDGGKESDCGWCKDRWGYSWQITPKRLMELTTSADREKAQRAMAAMMTMQKIDIATLEAAAEGA